MTCQESIQKNGTRKGQKYEVVNGDYIENEGEKKFLAHFGEQSENAGKEVTAQVCKVHQPLMSVKRICCAGHRVVFDEEGSFIENKRTLARIKIDDTSEGYTLDTWVQQGEGL